MRVGAAVALFLLVASSGQSGQATDVFEAILYRGMKLPFNQEAASFLVRGPDCRVHEVPWPKATKSREATYHGTPPAGTFAIVHTHPDSLPLPSPRDTELAKRTGFDVYVVTRGNVWMASAVDGNLRMLRKRERNFTADCRQMAIAVTAE